MPYSNRPYRLYFSSLCIVVFVIAWLFVGLSPALAELLYDRPVKTAQWRGTEIEYLSGTIIVQISPQADSSAVESLFTAYDCHTLGYSGYDGWALVGCDLSADVFDEIDLLTASSLIDRAEPNAIVRPCGFPNDPYFQDSSQWNLWNTGKHGVVDADIDAVEAWDLEHRHSGRRFGFGNLVRFNRLR